VNRSKNSRHSACSVDLLWLQRIKTILSDISVCSLWSTAFGELFCDKLKLLHFDLLITESRKVDSQWYIQSAWMAIIGTSGLFSVHNTLKISCVHGCFQSVKPEHSSIC